MGCKKMISTLPARNWMLSFLIKLKQTSAIFTERNRDWVYFYLKYTVYVLPFTCTVYISKAKNSFASGTNFKHYALQWKRAILKDITDKQKSSKLERYEWTSQLLKWQCYIHIIVIIINPFTFHFADIAQVTDKRSRQRKLRHQTQDAGTTGTVCKMAAYR